MSLITFLITCCLMFECAKRFYITLSFKVRTVLKKFGIDLKGVHNKCVTYQLNNVSHWFNIHRFRLGCFVGSWKLLPSEGGLRKFASQKSWCQM